MRVVVSAYACEPGGTSERGLGWLWASEASRTFEVHLVTRRQFEPKIAEAIASDEGLNLTVTYIDPPGWLTWWKRGERGLYPFYFLWQLLAWRTIRRLHRTKHFDVGHHVTFALDWLPAGVAFVPDLPSVWGPVGPGVTLPPLSLSRYLGARWLVTDLVRAVLTSTLRLVFGRATARRSAVVVGNNNEVARQYFAHPHFVLEQHAVIDRRTAATEPLTSRVDARAICVGRLVTWKGLDIAIEAISRAPGWRLDIYGVGPAEARLRRRVLRLRLAERVTFHGRVPHEQVLEAMQGASLLLFPSVRDSAPGTVAEAITLGLPVVCLDVGGPGTMVRPGEGVRVDPQQDVVRSVVDVLLDPPHPHVGQARWESSRIAGLVDDWYSIAALSRQARREASDHVG